MRKNFIILLIVLDPTIYGKKKGMTLDMEKIGRVELHPKFDGKQMIMVIQPL